MTANPRAAAVGAAIALSLMATSCDAQERSPARAGASTAAASTGPVLDLPAAVGEDVEVTATVHEVLHANALVITGGQVGPRAVLVTTSSLPHGIDSGADVRVVGEVVVDPPGSDPVMNRYKAAGPIITASSVELG